MDNRNKVLRIIIGADIAPVKSNYDLFSKGDAKTLVGDELLEKLSLADFTVFNLETPLTDKSAPIMKCGPNLIAPENTIKGLKAVNPHFFTLANNHIFDQGMQGLYSTIKLLDRAGIAHAGAGKDAGEASKPYIFEKNGHKIGIYCCAEHEFSIANENSPGANPYDPLASFDDVQVLKGTCEFVIVLYHGGKECYRYPSPELQRVFRKFAEKGADIVIAQHTHCIGCMEKYNHSYLIYGQGNFLFPAEHNEYWDSSVLIELTISGDKKLGVQYHPLVVCKNRIRLAEGKQKASILADFAKRSEEIQKKNFIQDHYISYIQTQGHDYAKVVKGENRILKRLFLKCFRRSFSFHYGRKRLLALLNFIECECHREIVIAEIKRCMTDVHGTGQGGGMKRWTTTKSFSFVFSIVLILAALQPFTTG